MTSSGSSVPPVAYDVVLQTIAAQQLWAGRQADDSHKFIPGMLDFHHTVVALESAAEGGNEQARAKLKTLDRSIAKTRADTSHWQCDTERFARDALPANARAHTAAARTDTRTVRFADARSRQLAMLIASFDAAAQSALATAAMASDLQLTPPTTAQAGIHRQARQIRQLLYLPRARRNAS